METFTKLPTAAKIAIPAGVLLVLFLLVYFTMLGGPSSVTVYGPKTSDEVAIAKWTLDSKKIKWTSEQAPGGLYVLKVLESDESAAGEALAGTNLETRIKKSKRPECVTPGQFAGSGQIERAAACQDEAKITTLVTSEAGIMAANVSVVREDSGELVGSEKISTVTVQLFLEPEAKIDARGLAGRISSMVMGGSMDRVVISDSNGTTLWSKDSAATGSSVGVGCMPGTEASNDITAKEQAVKSCLEQDLLSKIGEMVGVENATVSAGVRLSPAAETQTISDVTKAALLQSDEISNSGGGASSSNKSTEYAPSTTNTTRTKQAGYIERLTISATLNSTNVTPAQESAVRNMLKAYVDTERGDPMPSVISTKFAKPEKAEPAKGDTTKGAPTSSDAQEVENAAVTPTHMPKGILIVGILLLIGLGTIVAILWRSRQQLQVEQARFSAEFQNDQRLFENFAQSNPDDLARELEGLFGPPARSS